MTDQNQLTPERAKVIVQKAREKDAQDCLNAINQAVAENLARYRCVMFGTVTLVHQGVSIEVRGSGNNFTYGVIAPKE